jgi:hypothetical protein
MRISSAFAVPASPRTLATLSQVSSQHATPAICSGCTVDVDSTGNEPEVGTFRYMRGLRFAGWLRRQVSEARGIARRRIGRGPSLPAARL